MTEQYEKSKLYRKKIIQYGAYYVEKFLKRENEKLLQQMIKYNSTQSKEETESDIRVEEYEIYTVQKTWNKNFKGYLFLKFDEDGFVFGYQNSGKEKIFYAGIYSPFDKAITVVPNLRLISIKNKNEIIYLKGIINRERKYIKLFSNFINEACSCDIIDLKTRYKYIRKHKTKEEIEIGSRF